PPQSSVEEGYLAVRRLFETLARRQPLLVTFDDLQWAEPAFLDLIDHVVDLARDAPILLLCIARPEFLELRPGWGGGKVNALSVLLEPLRPDEAKSLIAALPTRELTPQLRARVMESAGGNPLFLEELLTNLAEGGTAAGDDDAAKHIEMPPTIQA